MREERYELKFLITQADYLSLKRQINLIMSEDKHTTHDQGYNLSSLYFDDIYDSATHDKADGVEFHKKFRIRRYEDDRTRLEYKVKNGNKTTKDIILLDSKMEKAIVDRDFSYLYDNIESPLMELLIINMKTNNLRPRLYVDYFREAYNFNHGDVRVTFDKDIYTYEYNKKIKRKVLEPQEIILEVKYRDIIPDFIRKIVFRNKFQIIAYSKYLMSWLKLND